MSDMPFDLTGCQVVQVTWPARGFALHLAGETAAGRSVADAVLTFEAVANLYELREFLSGKRRIVREGGVTRNTIADYPLGLPATLTHLKASRAARACYGDEAFTGAHGNPPSVGPGQRLYLFTLAEKRFVDRKPFPIICGRLTWADGERTSPSGEAPEPLPRWSMEEYQQLGMRFFEAVVMDALAAAREMLSKSCRKRFGNAAFRRRLGEYAGCGRRFAEKGDGAGPAEWIERLRPHMTVNVEDDEAIVWESVQNTPADFPREAARAQLELGSEFLRESLFVYVVAEDGEPRLELA